MKIIRFSFIYLMALGLPPGARAADERVAPVHVIATGDVDQIRVLAASDEELEDRTLEFSEQVLSPWKKAWRSRDAAAFSALFAAAAQTPEWAGRLESTREKEGIAEYRWKDAAPAARDRQGVAREAARYLKEFAAVESVSLDVLDGDFAAPQEPVFRVRFDLRGTLADGSRRNDRGTLRVRLGRAGAAWTIREIADARLETVVGRQTVFEDATRAAGLAGVPARPRTEAIRRGGYALAVADYALDGRPGIYLGGSGPGQLFRGRKDGTFQDVTAEAGLGHDTMVKAAFFGDLDGDGRTDLMLQRFVDQPEGELVFYRNLGGGKFEQAPAKVERTSRHDRAMSMAAADFDGDGRLDLYIGYPGVRDFTDGRMDDSAGVAHQAVYMNRGGWRFTEMAPASQPRLFTELIRPHSALATDINRDGKADLLVVDDIGNSSRLYLNLGDRFAPSEVQAGLKNLGWGMMAAAGDYAGDGRDAVYFTNIQLDAGSRLQRLIEQGGPEAKALAKIPELTGLRNVLQGNRLYRATGNATFREETDTAGVGWCGQASAGAAWVDYNADGLLDLYVSNGLWSADPERDHSSRFIRQLLKETLPGAVAAADPKETNPVMHMLQKTGVSFAGYQRNCLFRNNGDGTFTDVGYAAGADRIEDGYVVALADYDDDGKVDLVLRNADPASLDRPYGPVTLLRNKGVGGNRSVAVYLKAKTGADAFGTRLTLKAGGRTQTREIQAVVGAVQSQQAAFFGIGEARQADSLEVRWPSGRVETFTGIKPGRLLIKEGEKGVTYLASAR